MSDESSSVDAASSSQPVPSHIDEGGVQDVLPSAAGVEERRNRNRQMFNRKRVELLDDLIRNLDILVYAELSTIYYMDCFLFRLLVRAMIQFVFLTPKPPMIPAPPKPEPFIGAIFGSNALCLLLHLFCRAPAAGEATRGYLHGGLAIDFIGQKGPTSKLLLIFLDLVVMALQLVHLSAHVARSRLNESLTSTAAASALHAITQDLESEERGVRRSAEVLRLDAQATVELQSLNRLGNATTLPDADGEESDEGDSVLASTASPTDDFIFDAFKNGQIVLADLNPLRTVKEMVIRFHKAPPQVRRNAYHAHLAGSMMGLRLATGRTLGS